MTISELSPIGKISIDELTTLAKLDPVKQKEILSKSNFKEAEVSDSGYDVTFCRGEEVQKNADYNFGKYEETIFLNTSKHLGFRTINKSNYEQIRAAIKEKYKLNVTHTTFLEEHYSASNCTIILMTNTSNLTSGYVPTYYIGIN